MPPLDYLSIFTLRFASFIVLSFFHGPNKWAYTSLQYFQTSVVYLLVSNPVGEIVDTLIPHLIISSLKTSEKISTPALDMQYAEYMGK